MPSLPKAIIGYYGYASINYVITVWTDATFLVIVREIFAVQNFKLYTLEIQFMKDITFYSWFRIQISRSPPVKNVLQYVYIQGRVIKFLHGQRKEIDRRKLFVFRRRLRLKNRHGPLTKTSLSRASSDVATPVRLRYRKPVSKRVHRLHMKRASWSIPVPLCVCVFSLILRDAF